MTFKRRKIRRILARKMAQVKTVTLRRKQEGKSEDDRFGYLARGNVQLCIVAAGVLRLVKWKMDIWTCAALRDKIRYVQCTVASFLPYSTKQSPS
jgi:hypothetical protein